MHQWDKAFFDEVDRVLEAAGAYPPKQQLETTVELIDRLEKDLGLKISIGSIIRELEERAADVIALKVSAETLGEMQKQTGPWWDGKRIGVVPVILDESLAFGVWHLVPRSVDA